MTALVETVRDIRAGVPVEDDGPVWIPRYCGAGPSVIAPVRSSTVYERAKDMDQLLEYLEMTSDKLTELTTRREFFIDE